jgi:hypothetical protein
MAMVTNNSIWLRIKYFSSGTSDYTLKTGRQKVRKRFFEANETIYEFFKDSVFIKEKHVLTHDHLTFSFDTVAFHVTKTESKKILTEKKEYLELQISAEPDPEN